MSREETTQDLSSSSSSSEAKETESSTGSNTSQLKNYHSLTRETNKKMLQDLSQALIGEQEENPHPEESLLMVVDTDKTEETHQELKETEEKSLSGDVSEYPAKESQELIETHQELKKTEEESLSGGVSTSPVKESHQESMETHHEGTFLERNQQEEKRESPKGSSFLRFKETEKKSLSGNYISPTKGSQKSTCQESKETHQDRFLASKELEMTQESPKGSSFLSHKETEKPLSRVPADPWTIKRILTVSDVGSNVCRLTIEQKAAEEHILRHLSKEDKKRIEQGVKVKVYDHNMKMEHSLSFKRQQSSGTYVLQGGWYKHIVKRNGLEKDNEIGLYWGLDDSTLHFCKFPIAPAPEDHQNNPN